MKKTSTVHYYLYTFCRYFVATMILLYGFAKILGTQFSSPLMTYDTPVGELSGMELTWFYFGYSYPYTLFIALSQIAASMLLFFRKTVRLGIILFLCIMTNIVVIDITYGVDVDAFIMALLLTAMGVFIFVSEFKQFVHYFFTQPSLYTTATMPNWVNKLHKIKYMYIPLVCIGLFSMLYYVKTEYMNQNNSIFYGTWQLEKGDSSFQKLYFEGSSFQTVALGNADASRKGKFTFDTKAHTVTLSSYPNAYLEKIYTQADFVIDTNKRETLFKGTYELYNNQLTLKSDAAELLFKKIR